MSGRRDSNRSGGRDPRRRRRPRRAFALLAGLLVVAGCADAGPDPLALVITPETRSAVGLGLELPSFPRMIEDAVASEDPAPGGPAASRATPALVGRPAGAEPDGDPPHLEPPSGRGPLASLRREAPRWEETWLMDPARGREVRGRIYDRTTPRLAAALGDGRVRAELERLGRVARAVDREAPPDLPPGYRSRLAEVRELAAWGEATLERGDAAEALRAALEGADRLRALSPRRVAAALLERARRALDASDGETLSERSRERVERLVRGAEEALERGEHPLAIRRAYYACRLLGLRVF